MGAYSSSLSFYLLRIKAKNAWTPTNPTQQKPPGLHTDKANNQNDGFQPWHAFPQAAQLGKKKKKKNL